MTLPFSHGQFLDVFGRYNETLWPAALVLWLFTAGFVVQLLRGRDVAGVWMSALLAVHWLWAGLAYHLAYFRAINPAAVIFGAVFVLQGGLLAWRGVARRDLPFRVSTSGWSRIGLALVTYALLYPAIALASGLAYPRTPTFGVPCPTGILTCGILLLAPPSAARWVAPIPLLWALVGGSAAFVLDIRADLALVAAGVFLLTFLARPSTRRRVGGHKES